jgi:hypothetical protein
MDLPRVPFRLPKNQTIEWQNPMNPSLPRSIFTLMIKIIVITAFLFGSIFYAQAQDSDSHIMIVKDSARFDTNLMDSVWYTYRYFVDTINNELKYVIQEKWRTSQKQHVIFSFDEQILTSVIVADVENEMSTIRSSFKYTKKDLALSEEQLIEEAIHDDRSYYLQQGRFLLENYRRLY